MYRKSKCRTYSNDMSKGVNNQTDEEWVIQKKNLMETRFKEIICKCNRDKTFTKHFLSCKEAQIVSQK